MEPDDKYHEVLEVAASATFLEIACRYRVLDRLLDHNRNRYSVELRGV